MSRSLTIKLFFTLLIIFLLGLAGSIMFIVSIQNNLAGLLNEKMEQTGNLLADISREPISNNDTVRVNSFLRYIFKDGDFVSITILDRDGNIIGEETRYAKKSSEMNPFHVKPFFKKEIPVFSGNEKIGDILITASSSRVNSEISGYTVFIIYQSALAIAFILVAVGFFHLRVKKPISSLTSALKKASAGDMTVSIQPAKDQEMASLIKGFNNLITRLRDAHQKLHSTTNNVIAAIKQINLIIDNVKEGTHNQAGAAAEVIIAMENSDNFQKGILESSQNLGKFSNENLSSLMQIKATSEEINEGTEDLFKTSLTTYSTIAEISAAAKEIAQSAEELSTSTEQISVSIEQVSSNTKEVENSTKESLDLTYKVRDIASVRGMFSVADAMDGMDEIIGSVNKTLEIVTDLKIKSRDIEKVLTVIADVTKQTNLLSVNAAILAAQAGEYGKGFSVVADEIKMLADRTVSSAKDITNIVKTIQKGITEATQVTENSKIIAEKGNTLVVKTGEAFNDVIESAQRSSAMAETIQKATEEQVRGILQIIEAMDMIRMIVEHVGKATHEHETGSEHLVSVAERVKEASENIKRSMEEQTLGIALISKNLELTNEKIKSISESTLEYGKANELIMTAAARIGAICNNTLSIAQEMSLSFNTLYQEAEALKKDMEEF